MDNQLIQAKKYNFYFKFKLEKMEKNLFMIKMVKNQKLKKIFWEMNI